MRNKPPAVAGTIAALVIVGITGSQPFVDWVLDNRFDTQWLRRMTLAQWRLTPEDGQDYDVYVGSNLFPLLLVLLTGAFLIVVLGSRLDAGGPGGAFFGAWGATVAAGVVAAVVTDLWFQVIADDFGFVRGPGDGLLDRLDSSIGFLGSYALYLGLWVGLTAAVVSALTGGAARTTPPPPAPFTPPPAGVVPTGAAAPQPPPPDPGVTPNPPPPGSAPPPPGSSSPPPGSF